MNRGTLVRLAIISLVAAFAGPLMELGFYSGGIEYVQPVDPAAFHAMSYEEQQKWMAANSRKVSGLELIGSRLSEKSFYPEYFRVGLIYFVVVFVAGIALLRFKPTDHAL